MENIQRTGNILDNKDRRTKGQNNSRHNNRITGFDNKDKRTCFFDIHVQKITFKKSQIYLDFYSLNRIFAAENGS